MPGLMRSRRAVAKGDGGNRGTRKAKWKKSGDVKDLMPAVPFERRDIIREAEIAVAEKKGKKHKLRPIAVLGPNKHAEGTMEWLTTYLLTPKKQRDHSQLDELILHNGNASRPWSEIGRMTGLSAHEAQRRYLEILEQNYNLTPQELQLMQVARLESIINMLQDWAHSGSSDHIKLLLEAIRQLREVQGAANAKQEIVISILIEKQANVIILAVQHLFAKMSDVPELAPYLDLMNNLAAETMKEVQLLVQQAADTAVTVGPKGEVIVDADPD